jgi:hypothetical protein
MASTEKLNIHQKALCSNFDPTSNASFAEIGTGQEVVRWFPGCRRSLRDSCQIDLCVFRRLPSN